MGPIAWACSNQALYWCCWINDLPAIEIKLSPYDENLFKENNQLLISELIISGLFYPKEVIFLTGWDWLIFSDEFTFFPLQCLPHHYWRASSRSHLYYGTAQKISSYQGTHFTGEVVASTGWWNPLSPTHITHYEITSWESKGMAFGKPSWGASREMTPSENRLCLSRQNMHLKSMAYMVLCPQTVRYLGLEINRFK